MQRPKNLNDRGHGTLAEELMKRGGMRASVCANRLLDFLRDLCVSVVKIFIFCSLLLSAQSALAQVPAFDSVKQGWVSSEGTLLDRHGRVIHELRVIDRGRRLSWLPLDRVSPAAVDAIVRAEDKRFFRHAGVDWLALSDAALDTLLFDRARGASTISMQVAAMLDQQLMPHKGRRSLGQKWDQINAARLLEQAWSKRQILEAYLNLSTFRGELQGIDAAARGLFGKDASGLDAAESVLLAALLRGPNARPDQAGRRACALAQAMGTALPCGRIAALSSESLGRLPRIEPAADLAPHVARALLSAERRQVQTTLDGELQRFALDALQRQLADLAERSVADGAVLVADNASGQVLAYVGNAGNIASAFYVDGVRAARQAGSTLKPFLYAMAIEQRLLTAASLVDDSPVNLVTPTGLYVPQNYDRDFKGLVSARSALSSSLNVPAVRTLMLVGADPFVDRLRLLGFEDVTEDGDFYGFSLALGSAEVTLWQLVNAYRTLAGGGRWSPMVVEPVGTRATRLLDPGASWIVADILSDRLARSRTFGLDSPLAARHWTAVKTGTSKDMRDNWCVGFSGRYTVGVWVGNFDGSPMHDVSGISGAAPIWLEVVNFLHRAQPSQQPAAPAGVVRAGVVFDGDLEPAREEFFVAGTELARIAAKPAGASRVAIAYPGNGSVIAIDPDIPPAVQRVRLVMRPDASGFSWRINDQAIGSAQQDSFWTPVAGLHRLSLVDAAGAEVDVVNFEVRGRRAPAATIAAD
jgi:penicillin-binding protein 1C